MNDAELAYERVGSGLPVVFVTPLVTDRRIWDNQVEPFAQRYEVIRYDLRGYGHSSLGPRTGHSVAERAVEDLAVLLDELGVETAALVGLEGGAAIALKLALAQPTRIGALVLTNAIIYEVGRRVLEERLPQSPPRRFWPELTPAEQKDFKAALWHAAVVRMQNDIAERVRAWPDRPYKRYLAREYEVASLMDSLRDFAVPTLLVLSEWTGPFRAAQAEMLRRALPAGELAVVPRSAWLLPLQPAETYNRIVLDFLTAHYGPERSTPGNAP